MKKTLIILLSIFFANILYAQNNITLKNIKNYKSYDIKNKMRIIHIKNNIDTNIYCRLTFDISEHLQNDQKGIDKICFQLIEKQFSNNVEAQNSGIKFTFSKNSITASHSDNNIDTLLFFMSKILFEMKFENSDFNEVKHSLETALFPPALSPRKYTENKAREFMYPPLHPLHENYNKSDFRSIALSDCNDYFDEHYLKSFKFLFIMGNLDASATFLKAKEYFSDLENTKVNKTKIPKVDLPEHIKIHFHETKSKITGGKTYIHVIYPTSINPNSTNIYEAMVLNFVLGNYKTGKIHKKLISEKKIAELAVAKFTYSKKYGEFNCSVVCNPKDVAVVVNDIIDVQKNLIEKKILDAELQIAKKKIAKYFNKSLKKPEKVFDMLYKMQKYQLKRNYYSKFLTNLKFVKTSDVQNLAKKQLLTNRYTVVVLGKDTKIKNEFLKLSDKAETIIYEDNEETDRIPFGFTAQNIIDDYLKALNFKSSAKAQKIKMKGVYHIDNEDNIVTHKILRKAGNYKSTMLLHPLGNKKILMKEEVFYNNNALLFTPEHSKTVEGRVRERIKTRSYQLPELEYSKNKEIKVNLMGIFHLDTADTYKVRVKYPYGDVRFDYYDMETKLKIKSEQVEKIGSKYKITKTIYTSDYRVIPKTKNKLFPYKKTLVTENYTADFKLVYISTKARIPRKEFKFNKYLIRK